MNETRYKLVVAQDGIIWASLQPLFLDLEEKLAEPHLAEPIAEKLRTVLDFISHLIIEGENQ